MELWIRSTSRTNLLKIRFLTIMEGKKFYKKEQLEYEGYTIANCSEQGNYELLGTYKTRERALEVLDEIQKYINNNCEFIEQKTHTKMGTYTNKIDTNVYEMPSE